MSAALETPRAPLVVFRPIIPDDRRFFAAGWLRSFKRRGTSVKAVHAKTYDYFQARTINRLVARGSVLMAVDPQDPRKRLHGFVCFEGLRGTCVLHYVYVKGDSRGRGIGSALIRQALDATEANALVWTHRTSGFDAWVRRFAERERPELPLLYNPFLVDQENHG